MDTHRFSHIGICVSELERSVRFYRDVLGFLEVSRLEMEGAVTERLLEIAGGELQAVYLTLGSTCIELLFYPAAGHMPSESPRPMNKLGLTHLSLGVADVDAVVKAIAPGGGAVLDQTRIERNGASKAIFVTDPDGMRIELVQASGNTSVVPGN
jgi:catechol 2,3-dioxygenase-like lactoylglutathione lyase family enzyme